MTLAGFLDHQAARFPSHAAVVSGTTRWSYAELAREVWALHLALAELGGVGRGDRVALWLSSFPEWIVWFFALARLGAVPVPVNPRFGSHELAYILDHSASAMIVAMGRYLERDYGPPLAEALARLPRRPRVVGVRGLEGADVVDAAALRARGAERLARAGAAPPAAPGEDDVAGLFYTSGTTAFPKGVPLTHRNVLPHSVACGTLLGLGAGDRVLSLYPFFGVSGGVNKIVSTLAWGATLVFPHAFAAEEAYDLLERERCTVIHAVDVQIRELIAVARRRHAGEPPARRGTVGFIAGADPALARAMGEVLGLRRFVHPYGMTETNPMILCNALDDPFDVCLRAGGRVASGVEIAIVDPETGGERQDGEAGEIVARGDTVAREYYRDPGATAEAFDARGWFHTGDLGVRTPDHLVFYLGRLKDTLKTGGFNVAPQEVEAFLRTHPDVADAGVTGAADARLGEVPVAFVVRRAGATAGEAELIAFCRGRIANFKVPKRIRFVDALPYQLGAHGAKLLRKNLREWASSAPGEMPGATGLAGQSSRLRACGDT